MAAQDVPRPPSEPPAVPSPPQVDRRQWAPPPAVPQAPRRVRGGIKLTTDDAALLVDRRSAGWVNLAKTLHDVETFDRGREFAVLGQAVAIRAATGRIEVEVQGSRRRPDRVAIEVQPWSEDQWRTGIELLAGEPAHAAGVLTGAVSEATFNLLDRAGLPLAATTPESVTVTASGPTPDAPTLAVCGLLVLAQRALSSPAELFAARGLSLEAVQERIRQHRMIQAQGQASAHPEPRIEGAGDTPTPLEDCIDTFWSAPIMSKESGKPSPPISHISHALLRRLGPSPMGGSFPIVGLLASVYDEVAADIQRRVEALEAEDSPVVDGDP